MRKAYSEAMRRAGQLHHSISEIQHKMDAAALEIGELGESLLDVNEQLKINVHVPEAVYETREKKKAYSATKKDAKEAARKGR